MKQFKVEIPYTMDGITGIVEANDISDGYHTMHELYDHRRLLSVHFFHTMSKFTKHHALKALRHHDGSMFEGYFIVMAVHNETNKQVSYHYDMKYWDDFNIQSFDKCPYEYDGHTSQDVLERLKEF